MECYLPYDASIYMATFCYVTSAAFFTLALSTYMRRCCVQARDRVDPKSKDHDVSAYKGLGNRSVVA
jgi:hypothetical protein